MPLLSLDRVTKRFGGVLAVDDVSFDMAPGTAVGMIGPNGSGKSTLLSLVNGLNEPDSGEIRYKGRVLNRLPPHQIARAGIATVFQTTRIFRALSVLDNMVVMGLWMGQSRSDLLTKAKRLLATIGLAEAIQGAPAGELSGGQQKLLELAMSLMTEPDLLLLDEPTAGVHPALKAQMIETLLALQQQGKTVLVVSHDLPSVMNLCERLLVLAAGRIIADGDAETVRTSQAVIDAYLGM